MGPAASLLYNSAGKFPGTHQAPVGLRFEPGRLYPLARADPGRVARVLPSAR